MIVPECAPCDVQHLTPIATVYLACAFGVLALAAGVLVLKGVEIWLSCRALILNRTQGRAG